MDSINKIFAALKGATVDSIKLSLDLFKIMVPVIIVVKVLQELGAIEYLALPLAPVMEFVGLPPETGLVWATTLINTIYSGIMVYLTLLPDMPTLSVAQITVLSTMMLIAHTLPIEVRIAAKCGLNLWGQVVLRLGGALALAWLIHVVCDGFGLLTEPSRILGAGLHRPESGLGAWALGELRNLVWIFLIIFSLMILMRVINRLRVTDLLAWLLRPALWLVGVGRQAATITIVGLVLGVSYGAGLIIHESRSGRVPRQDVFASVSLMGLSHGLIEDTLLTLLLGASIHGVLWGRLAFSLAVVAVLSRVAVRLRPDRAGKEEEGPGKVSPPGLS